MNDNSAKGIRQAVKTVLAQPAYRESAIKISDSFRQAGGAGTAADVIEGFLNEKA